MRVFIIALLLLLFATSTWAQSGKDQRFLLTPDMIYSFGQSYNSWSVTAGFGPVFMYVDQSDYQFFPNQKIDFGPSFWVTKHLVPAFAFELQYLQSKMHGEGGLYAFDGDLLDFSLNGIAIINQMSSRPGPINDRWNYYLKIGVGATLFRSRLLHADSESVVTRSELYGNANPNYVVLGYDVNEPQRETERETEIVLPLGVGLMYRINHSFDVGIESVLRFSASDKLDNILTGATNDRYLFTALNVSYKFGKKDQRHVRWTYRADDMDMFGRKTKNQLEDDVRMLEEDIAEYAASRPVHKDSVVIVETLRVIYDQYKVRTIFFPTGRFQNFSPSDQLLLGGVAIELQNDTTKKAFLYGYSDTAGSSDKNRELSRNRCQAVIDFMVEELAVDSQRIEMYPRGEEDPLSPVEELTPRGLQMVNRRVDILIK
jgi:outer membrane protein OmpA-like peptidoglycan-associated protein